MKLRITMALVLLATSAPLMAEGMKIEPGLWELTSTISMPMAPQPRTMTQQECFTEAEVTPETFGDESFNESCSFDVGEISSNSMKWTFDCAVAGGSTSGTWQATSTGDTISGSGEMAMSMPEQNMEMSMTMEWEGKRVGDCP